MRANAKDLLLSLLGLNAEKKIAVKKAVKPAISRLQKERSELIDQIVASGGSDLRARQRLFQLS